jgi:hypothetical protein
LVCPASPNVQALLVKIQRIRELALVHQDIANTFVTDRELSLPVCVGFVMVGQGSPNVQALFVKIQRLLELAFGLQDIANTFVTDREISLQSCIGVVLLG